ncbi:MAG: YgfZ/GcvT domain-containing protein [Leptospirillia bacterium]
MSGIRNQAIHAGLNARFTELDGQPVVAGYGDVAEEVRRVRATGGLIDRSYRAVLSITGPDRGALLQSLSTNNVVGQPVGSAIANAICTNHGKAQSLFTCIRLAESYLLDMDPLAAGDTAAFLEKYTIVRDAKTEDVSTDWGHIGLYGPQSLEVLAAATGGDALPDTEGAVVALADGVLVVATAEAGLSGFELLIPATHFASLWERLMAAGREYGVTPFGVDALETLRIESGRPRFGVELDDGHIVLEAGLSDLVSFEKGCYLGQETLSRVVFRGQLSRRLCGLILDGDDVPQAGAPVLEAAGEGKEVGVVMSAVASPTLGKTVALAYLKRAFWEPGTKLTVGGVSAQVSELPFVAPDVAQGVHPAQG